MYVSTWIQLAGHHHAAEDQSITNYITRPMEAGTKQFAVIVGSLGESYKGCSQQIHRLVLSLSLHVSWCPV